MTCEVSCVNVTPAGALYSPAGERRARCLLSWRRRPCAATSHPTRSVVALLTKSRGGARRRVGGGPVTPRPTQHAITHRRGVAERLVIA